MCSYFLLNVCICVFYCVVVTEYLKTKYLFCSLYSIHFSSCYCFCSVVFAVLYDR